MNPPRSLDFLQGEPEPVRPGSSATPEPADLLPQAVAEQLMKLDGVDGAWIERDAQGGRVVVLHYSKPGAATHLPASAHGLPVKVVGGEPIRAGL
jgi:hypothetical protein